MKKIFAIFITLMVMSSINVYGKEEGTKVHFLNTYQSDNIIVQGNGINFMIDCGWSYTKDHTLNYLKEQEINKIDFVILTHYHDDHRGDIIDICEKMKVPRVYMSPHKNIYKDELVEKFNTMGVEVNFITNGWTLCCSDVFLKAIGPIKCDKTIENNNSIVLHGFIDNIYYLFAADMEREEEKDIMKTHNLCKYDVLKVPHHGLNTSSTKELIAKTNPSVAVITSDGEESPDDEVIYKLESIGADIYRTDKNGDIVISRRSKEVFKIEVTPNSK